MALRVVAELGRGAVQPTSVERWLGGAGALLELRGRAGALRRKYPRASAYAYAYAYADADAYAYAYAYAYADAGAYADAYADADAGADADPWR